jgi:tetratricopeptide (TPR) repeat protein
MPNVYWLIRAQRGLKEALAEQLADDRDNRQFQERCQAVSGKLARTFPRAEAIVVRDRLRGYRSRPDSHVLLVEVIPQAGPGRETVCAAEEDLTAHIVKVGDPAELAKELDGWRSCKPCGLTHDSILMPLRAGAPGEPPDGRPASLVYDDAYQVLGAGEVVSLEQAVLDCCRWGSPSLASIEQVLRQLFERLGTLFYNRSYVPAAAAELGLPLERWLNAWDEHTAPDAPHRAEQLRCRRETLGFLSRQRDTFLDPCDYLRSVARCPAFVPRLLRGCGHGDLHGRNVLVGLVQGEASAPAVYDYEDTGPDKLIGWDFVKMETELKVRALPLLLSGPETGFIERVHRFEVELAERTEQIHDQGSADDDVAGPPELRRLAAVVLEVRRQAKLHLGTRRNRAREWLEEYYFLLACYGVCAGRYATYQRRHLIGAYNAAGVAARRLSRPWTQLAGEITARESEAVALLPGPGRPEAPAPDGFRLPPRDGEMSYHARFAFAQKWSRCGHEPWVRAALPLLGELHREYPHVLEIDEELALALLELKEREEAERVLQEVARHYRYLHEETYCRWGRLWKDRALQLRDEAGPGRGPLVPRYLGLALDQYRRAYAIREHYYPGINVAALLFVLGRGDESARVARAVLAALLQAGPHDDLLWAAAARAEAHLLLGEDDEAERHYRQVVADRLCAPHARHSMRRQAELIVAHAAEATRSRWTRELFEHLFGRVGSSPSPLAAGAAANGTVPTPGAPR